MTPPRAPPTDAALAGEECPSDRCPMCTGESCDLCGAGSWNNAAEHCEHDVLDRHTYGGSATTPSSDPPTDEHYGHRVHTRHCPVHRYPGRHVSAENLGSLRVTLELGTYCSEHSAQVRADLERIERLFAEAVTRLESSPELPCTLAQTSR